MMDVREALAAARRDGFVVLHDVLSGDDLNAFQAEADWFLTGPQPWFSFEEMEHGKMAMISPFSVPPSESHRLARISEVLSRPIFRKLCQGYLPLASVDRLIVHRETAHEEPITEWHSDQQQDGLRGFKLMLYLSDVSRGNGAFAYVPGSHRIVAKVEREAARRGFAYSEVHHFERIKASAVELGLTDCHEALDRMSEHIRGDYDSDDYYCVEAERGAVIAFDTHGVHRGGVASSGDRYIARLHCFEPAVAWKAHVKQCLPWLAKQPARLFW